VKTRSLRFQLLTWYAVLLLGCLGALGAASYLLLERSLVGSLTENQLRRARQVGQLLREELERHNETGFGKEVEARYAPGLSDRVVRVTRRDGVVLYLSSPPKDQSFDVAGLPPANWPTAQESSRQVALLGGRKLLLAQHEVRVPAGQSFLVESGAPMDEVQADLRKWLVVLGTLLPAVLLLALAGGSLLVKRALLPVDRIASSAERISSENLAERLPVPQTADELERLSLALNHMIERLEQAFQHSRRFVADASHELRTPLTVLRGELESVVQQPHLNAEWRERLGSALEEVLRLSNIVEGLFAISRLDAGEAAAEWAQFDLAELASSTADQMALLAEDKHIRVQCAASKEVWVRGDRARLKQVVVNLLDNAIKYTPEGGSVTLTVSSQNSHACLEVADNGIGIPAAALPRVFERFFRVDKARSREAGGAGLGLSIAQSIVTAHHGQIQASSAPGQGSRFRMELPLAAAPANSNHRPKNHEH
jgi:heavy metal sensor kinase